MQHPETCLLVAETDRVLCNVVKLFNCLFRLDAQNEIQLLARFFMARLFIGFLVEKCATCQSHRKSDFGWTHSPLLNAY